MMYNIQLIRGIIPCKAVVWHQGLIWSTVLYSNLIITHMEKKPKNIMSIKNAHK